MLFNWLAQGFFSHLGNVHLFDFSIYYLVRVQTLRSNMLTSGCLSDKERISKVTVLLLYRALINVILLPN